MIDDNLEPLPELLEPPKRRLSKFFLRLFLVVSIALLLTIGLFFYLNQPAATSGTQTVLVGEGATVPEITNHLKEAGVVKSDTFLYIVLVTNFDPTAIKASRYIFQQPLTTFEVAELLMTGDFDTDLQALTIFEGESRKKIAERLSRKFNWFEKEKFIELTTGDEGKLFPDTYHIPENYSTEKLVELLHSSYQDVMRSYLNEILASSLSESDIVTLASIVEREAKSGESMKTVAGIFLNRLDIGMALQADATIEYVLDEGLDELPPGVLAETLRETDSPYNTYMYPGLPPSPIGNPGREAIEAVLFPIETDYLYYITGDDGQFYYAENYNQHLKNISNHLR